ncbi:MAG TPA: hypothetical protein VD768_06240 [Sphingomicrobium sp.]|nr:hypothetical protein [Sphingomicrobium sp.]
MDTSSIAIIAAGSVPDPTTFVIGAGAVRPTEEERAQIEEKLREIVNRLEKLADEQVAAKGPTEQRWIKNLRQFHGRYDSDTEQELIDAKKSRAFVKITRKKTNSWKGRLESLIYPTDDRNYGIQPTPIPSLTKASKEVVEQAMALVEQANEQQAAAAQAAEQGDEQQAAQAAAAAAASAERADEIALQAKRLAAEIEEAKKRADAMLEVMDDQLIECQFQAEGRDSIFDFVRLGTAIIKGPLASERTRGRWVPKEERNDAGEPYTRHVYEREADPAPIFKRVDPWSYFPDMSARKKGEEEFEFERHLWSKKDLRQLAREGGFNKDAVRRLLNEKADRGATAKGMSYLSDLRSISGTGESLKGRYVGWEYHGPLESEEIVTMLQAMGEYEDAAYYRDNEDPLVELKVICYFCEGELLKIAPEYPLDSQESLYSVAPFEPSEADMFGVGIPDIMEDSQAALNAGWRMMMDNAGLSTGPQIVVDRDSIEPANHSWDVSPRKLWWRKKGAAAGQQAFEVFNIPNAVAEIMSIVSTARQFIDDETALPVQSEGEVTDNPNVTATASNIMAMGFNVTFRSVVKSWDDGITAPSMRRLYDWNMQHNKREDIKGDMSIDARGTSVLLVREIQSQMLMAVATNHTQHPTLALMLKPWETYRNTLKAMMIQPDEIMVSKDDWEKAIKAQAEAAQEQPEAPQVIAAQMALERTKLEGQTQLQIAQMNRETEMIKLAEQRNMKLDELQALLQSKEMDIGSKERMFAGELGAERLNAERAAARGEKPTGSGGFISAGSVEA